VKAIEVSTVGYVLGTERSEPRNRAVRVSPLSLFVRLFKLSMESTFTTCALVIATTMPPLSTQRAMITGANLKASLLESWRCVISERSCSEPDQNMIALREA
jgi:hypothetical protein